MPYTILIQRVATGQTVEHHETGAWSDPGEAFWWRDGNMSCDCNRALMFEAAGGNVFGDPGECGSERFTCVAVLPDGSRVNVDEDR